MNYYVKTLGWISEEEMLNRFIDATEQRKKYELFVSLISEETKANTEE